MLERLLGSRTALVGLVLLVLAWGPLFAIGLLTPDANPIGLGLLAVACTPVGVGLLAVGLATSPGASTRAPLLVVARILGGGLGLLVGVAGLGALGMGGLIVGVVFLALGAAAIAVCAFGRVPRWLGARG